MVDLEELKSMFTKWTECLFKPLSDLSGSSYSTNPIEGADNLAKKSIKKTPTCRFCKYTLILPAIKKIKSLP
jgi:hypothetical protein